MALSLRTVSASSVGLTVAATMLLLAGPTAAAGIAAVARYPEATVRELDGAHGWAAWTHLGPGRADGAPDRVTITARSSKPRTEVFRGRRVDRLRVVRVQPAGGPSITRVLVRSCSRRACETVAIDPASRRRSRPAWAKALLGGTADGRWRLSVVAQPSTKGEAGPVKQCPTLTVRTLEGALVRALPTPPSLPKGSDDPLRCVGIDQVELLGDRLAVRARYEAEFDSGVQLMTMRLNATAPERWGNGTHCFSRTTDVSVSSTTEFALDDSGIACQESHAQNSTLGWHLTTALAFDPDALDAARDREGQGLPGLQGWKRSISGRESPCDVTSDGAALYVLASTQGGCTNEEDGTGEKPKGDFIDRVTAPAWNYRGEPRS